jgi:hypothetical protein
MILRSKSSGHQEEAVREAIGSATIVVAMIILLGGFGIEPSHTQRVENSYAKDAGGKTSEAVDYTPTF